MSGRWKKWTIRPLVAVGVLALVVVAIFEFGFADRWIRSAIVSQIQERTGARAEIGGFHFNPWRLSVGISNFTVHGLEEPGAPPLFHADRIDASVRILSFFGRQFALDRLAIDEPEVAIIDRQKRAQQRADSASNAGRAARGARRYSVCASGSWRCAAEASVTTTSGRRWRSTGGISSSRCTTTRRPLEPIRM